MSIVERRKKVCGVYLRPQSSCGAHLGLVPAIVYERIDEVASHTFAVVEELKQVRPPYSFMRARTQHHPTQAIPVQLERTERVKTVAEEIKALKL